MPDEDEEKLRGLQTDMVKALESPTAAAVLGRAREQCARAVDFYRYCETHLGPFTQPVLQKYGVDKDWYARTVRPLAEKDEDIKRSDERLAKLCSFGTVGPLLIEKGKCVRILGVSQELDDRFAIVTRYVEEEGRYEVVLSVLPTVSQRLLPENLQKVEEGERFARVQEEVLQAFKKPEAVTKVARLREASPNRRHFEEQKQAVLMEILGPVFLRNMVDFEWWMFSDVAARVSDEALKVKCEQIERLASFGTLGPMELEKGVCVEIASAGASVEPVTGIVTGYLVDEGCYQVRLKPKLTVLYSPKYIKKLSNKEVVLRMQAAMLAVLKSPECEHMLSEIRTRSLTSQHFEDQKREPLGAVLNPVFERFGYIDLTDEALGEEVAAQTKAIEEATSFGTIGPLPVERGSCVEVCNLPREHDELNGRVGIVSSFQQDQGLYTVFLRGLKEKPDLLKPEHIKKVGTKEQYHGFQVLLLKELEAAGAEAKVQALRATHSGKALKLALWGAFVPQLTVACETYAVDPGRYAANVSALLAEDKELLQRQREIERLLPLGALPEAEQEALALDAHSGALAAPPPGASNGHAEPWKEATPPGPGWLNPLGLECVANFRDVAGAGRHETLAVQGGVLWRGKLFRTGQMNLATERDRAKLREQVGLRTYIDLRDSRGLEALPGAVFEDFPPAPGPRGQVQAARPPGQRRRAAYHLGRGMGDRDLSQEEREGLPESADLKARERLSYKLQVMSPAYMGNDPELTFTVNDMYYLFVSGDLILGALRELTEPANYPAVLGCVGGKDRTGLMVMLVLGALGASEEDMRRDFLLSNEANRHNAFVFNMLQRRAQKLAKPDGPDRPIPTKAELAKTPDDALRLASCFESTFDAVMAAIRERGGGSIPAYLESIGFHANDVAKLRDILVDPTGDGGTSPACGAEEAQEIGAQVADLLYFNDEW